jgi:hypothetical protein
MVSFRRVLTAIAVLALFVGLASAQVGGGGSSSGPLQCAANVTSPPLLRAEGLTEEIGDIVISCTGGPNTVNGTPVSTANITVSLNAQNVTSRLLNGGVVSEATLLIDEPNSGLPGAGAALPIQFCAAGATANPAGGGTPSPGGAQFGIGGCPTYANTGAGFSFASTCTGFTGGVCTTFGYTPNAFQGVVSGNQVTFNGVPLLAPVTAGFARVFRITNVRANVASLGNPGQAGTAQLVASVAISGQQALLVTNPVQVAGFIQAGLSASIRSSGGSTSGSNIAGINGTFLQCLNFPSSGSSPSSSTFGDILDFRPTFNSAFKTRVAATSTYSGNFAGPGFAEGTPGTIYNASESGLILTGPAGGSVGLADYGTRLKAVFNNIPAGVNVFVSVTNISNVNSTSLSTTFTAASVVPGSVTPIAVIVPTEAGPNFFGLSPIAIATVGSIAVTQLPVTGNSATAVWEIVQTNSALQDVLQFAVYYTFRGNQGAGTPPAGTATVNLSFAPTAGPFTFPATGSGNGGTASGSLTIPRFVDLGSFDNLPVLTIFVCQTNLLYPFVTNINGFDTGLAIANTTTDPFGTKPQNGPCVLNWYGSTPPPQSTVVAPCTTAGVCTGVVNSGTVYANTASTLAPGAKLDLSSERSKLHCCACLWMRRLRSER